MLKSIPVFYRPEMSVAINDSFSPSAGKPTAYVNTLKEYLLLPIEIRSFQPVTMVELCGAHNPDYVDGVLSNTLRNGFGNFDEMVTNSLPYTSGSFLAASREALKNGKIACSPTSGFHHATWEGAGGFCTFNGLMVAARQLVIEDPSIKILILDCDYHYGNGTVDIINKKFLHPWVDQISFGKTLTQPNETWEYLEELDSVIDTFDQYDLIMYQAGADSHIDDPFGGMFTTQELITRDVAVFEGAAVAKTPIVWNLAGGYQRDFSIVLGIHVNTMMACINAFGLQREDYAHIGIDKL